MYISSRKSDVSLLWSDNKWLGHVLQHNVLTAMTDDVQYQLWNMLWTVKETSRRQKCLEINDKDGSRDQTVTLTDVMCLWCDCLILLMLWSRCWRPRVHSTWLTITCDWLCTGVEGQELTVPDCDYHLWLTLYRCWRPRAHSTWLTITCDWLCTGVEDQELTVPDWLSPVIDCTGDDSQEFTVPDWLSPVIDSVQVMTAKSSQYLTDYHLWLTVYRCWRPRAHSTWLTITCDWLCTGDEGQELTVPD